MIKLVILFWLDVIGWKLESVSHRMSIHVIDWLDFGLYHCPDVYLDRAGRFNVAC